VPKEKRKHGRWPQKLTAYEAAALAESRELWRWGLCHLSWCVWHELRTLRLYFEFRGRALGFAWGKFTKTGEQPDQVPSAIPGNASLMLLVGMHTLTVVWRSKPLPESAGKQRGDRG